MKTFFNVRIKVPRLYTKQNDGYNTEAEKKTPLSKPGFTKQDQTYYIIYTSNLFLSYCI